MPQSEMVIFFQPPDSLTTFNSEQGVTSRVIENGIGEIQEYIDSNDYDIGAFAFGDLEITFDNADGFFNEPRDFRSMFTFGRNQTKVRVVYRETEFARDSSGLVTSSTETDTTIFRGLINEEATRCDLTEQNVTFRILSRDSVIRNNKVTSGQIANGSLASDAIQTILNIPEITKILTFTPANINVGQDFTIDDGSVFDNLTTFDALVSLLGPTNSILRIDASDNIIVASRDELATSALLLFGKDDMQSRQNILDIQNLNSGFHRMFNSIKIGTIEVNDTGFIEDFGLRQKDFTLEYITTDSTKTTIGTSLLAEFKEPRQEVEVIVDMAIAKDATLLQKVSVNNPLRLLADNGKFLPVVGQAKYDDTDTPYPFVFGDEEIHPNVEWKIIEKRHDPNEFITLLKLRQTNEGYSA